MSRYDPNPFDEEPIEVNPFAVSLHFPLTPSIRFFIVHNRFELDLCCTFKIMCEFEIIMDDKSRVGSVLDLCLNLGEAMVTHWTFKSAC